MSKRAVKMPSKLKLIDLKLTSADGKVEREIVALETITVFNLHRVFQLCLFPSKSDDAIAATVRVAAHFRNQLRHHAGQNRFANACIRSPSAKPRSGRSCKATHGSLEIGVEHTSSKAMLPAEQVAHQHLSLLQLL